ncbi:DNA-binding transcriptional regulator, AcrR family [Brevibacterium siliguriense]|uniref:DNA-binding transcriptional regulator, AcrR family n=1 Tax=Brevibacterium siliguriense TaxID=1136497 RepID=A0A1H1P674_9MICO|nr:TetR/AcrR family transcriptional regulator [Brevibacterium siliguriense]SDS06692.1 DNA-binding transcriptional regulator, AcrR family [Brevibacterium siliguriense]
MIEQDSTELRTDARRNVDRIREAAVEVFREEGFSASLDEVASRAGVSRATIFNRFGGRAGLIDAVIDAVVASELRGIIDDARSASGVKVRIRGYISAIRDIQYRIPAVNDVLLQEFPESGELMALCHRGSRFHDELVAEGCAEGVLSSSFAAKDFHELVLDNAAVLKHRGRPSRPDYDRRTEFVLNGILR